MKNKEQIEFGLLENGLDFVQSAIEFIVKDFDKSDFKYGLLHLSSGVELVLKYRLSKEHWSLLFQKVDEAKKDKYESGDFKSVDYATCVNRLKEICMIEFKDKLSLTAIDELRKKRNKMEHFKMVDSSVAIKVNFVKVLSFILDFIEEEFDSTDLKEKDISILAEIRSSLGGFRDFIDHRSKLIKDDLENLELEFNITYCPTCYERALIINEGCKCLFCNYSNSAEKSAEDLVSSFMYNLESEICDCPDCGVESFVKASSPLFLSWICLNCGIEYRIEDVEYCDTCGHPYHVTVGDVGMCNDCISSRIG